MKNLSNKYIREKFLTKERKLKEGLCWISRWKKESKAYSTQSLEKVKNNTSNAHNRSQSVCSVHSRFSLWQVIDSQRYFKSNRIIVTVERLGYILNHQLRNQSHCFSYFSLERSQEMVQSLTKRKSSSNLLEVLNRDLEHIFSPGVAPIAHRLIASKRHAYAYPHKCNCAMIVTLYLMVPLYRSYLIYLFDYQQIMFPVVLIKISLKYVGDSIQQFTIMSYAMVSHV